MTVLQLILLATHGFIGFICWHDGRRTGFLEGRKSNRRHYENLERQFKVSK